MIEHPYIKNADIKRWREATARGLPLLLSDIKNGKTQKGRRFYQL